MEFFRGKIKQISSGKDEELTIDKYFSEYQKFSELENKYDIFEKKVTFLNLFNDS